jgi:hypothetical protein
MKIYETNASLGYNQLVYIIPINETKNGYDYLVIGLHNIRDEEYELGGIIEDLESFYLEESNFKIEESPLYGTFLFDFFLKNYYF